MRSDLHGFGRPSCVLHASLFQQRAENGFRQLRLFALGYPELAEAWAQRVVEVDPSPPDWERWAACSALALLANCHWGAARSVLLRKSKDPTSNALRHLVRLEGVALHRELTLDRARLGQPWAIRALAEFPNAEARSVLEDLLTRDPDRPAASEAQEASTHMNELGSDYWGETARRSILYEDDRHLSSFFWTLEILRKRKPVWLESALRGRLDLEHQSGRVRPTGNGFEVESWVFDDILLALWELGCPVSARERAYLREHGYGVDPRVRLAEILP